MSHRSRISFPGSVIERFFVSSLICTTLKKKQRRFSFFVVWLQLPRKVVDVEDIWSKYRRAGVSRETDMVVLRHLTKLRTGPKVLI